jgi:hypothetical protein
MEKSLRDKSIGNNFLNKIPTAWKIRARIDKCGCNKLKTLLHSKGNSQWKKIIASYTCDKILKTSIYLELKKIPINCKRTINPINEWAYD